MFISDLEYFEVVDDSNLIAGGESTTTSSSVTVVGTGSASVESKVSSSLSGDVSEVNVLKSEESTVSGFVQIGDKTTKF